MDVPLLITLIEGFPNLYDKQRKDFRDKQKRNNSWNEISNVIGESVEECQRVWQNLRERYVKERRNENPRSGAAQVEITWVYFDNLRFLDKHISCRKTSTNIQKSSVVDENVPPNTWDSISEALVESEKEIEGDARSDSTPGPSRPCSDDDAFSNCGTPNLPSTSKRQQGKRKRSCGLEVNLSSAISYISKALHNENENANNSDMAQEESM